LKTWKFTHIYTQKGWVQDLYIQTDTEGIITSVSESPTNKKINHYITDLALPSLVNSHSHSFQWAMAGLSEHLDSTNTQDDFWSWRSRMYKLTHNLTPDDVQNIAEALYSENLKQGYYHIVEFHYLHNDIAGNPYSSSTEMSQRLIAAAQNVGIGMTLIPIFYNQGGFNTPPSSSQLRFITSDLDSYFSNIESLQSLTQDLGHISIGIGPHSLRAITTHQLKEIFNYSPLIPLHLHISEQEKEVFDCIQAYGARPIDWLYDNVKPNSNTNFVHATHISLEELNKIQKSNSNIVLCPSTEANLGDGIFPLNDYIDSGNFCIGTDSHIGLCPFEELRWLEYTQRLIHKKRNPLCRTDQEQSGNILFKKALLGGLQSAGFKPSFFAPGDSLNFFTISSSNPFISNTPHSHRLSQLIYNTNTNSRKDHYVAGNKIIEDLNIENHTKIQNNFSTTLKKIQSAI